MSEPSDRKKALVLAGIEDGWNSHDLAIFDELLDAELIDHSVPHDLPATRDGTKRLAIRYWSAFPDLRLTVEDQLAEDDRVVTRWTASGTHRGTLMGLVPTGKRVTMTGIRIDRVVGDRIVETWAEVDQFGLMRQLGIAMAGADARKAD